jgi:hypothetical protein
MTEAGVRTVSVGGRPKQGPMQTASGNRGAAVYSAYQVDDDYEVLKDLLKDQAAYDRLPSRKDSGMWTRFASFNLRDQMRADDLVPLQFRYEASDCRLYYTTQNVHDMGQLWRDVASATWDNPALCVPGSTNYSKRTEKGRKLPPKRPNEAPVHYVAPENPFDDPLDKSSNITTGLVDYDIPITQRREACSGEYSCAPSLICVPITTYCSIIGDINLKVKVCVDSCSSASGIPDCMPLQRVKPQSVNQKPAARGQSTDLSTSSASLPVYNGYIDPGPVQYQKRWNKELNSPSICGR